VPALPYPKYGLKSLYLFPYYQTREDYRQATGQEPPPWDPNRPPKYWRDASAGSSTRRNVVYDLVVATGPTGTPVAGPDGKPVLDIGGVVTVKNVTLYQALEVGFTAQDRVLLRGIARKLGVVEG
jgi:hypothetical protein